MFIDQYELEPMDAESTANLNDRDDYYREQMTRRYYEELAARHAWRRSKLPSLEEVTKMLAGGML